MKLYPNTKLLEVQSNSWDLLKRIKPISQIVTLRPLHEIAQDLVLSWLLWLTLTPADFLLTTSAQF